MNDSFIESVRRRKEGIFLKKMKAAILKDWNVFAMEEVPMPVITKPDEIISKVLVCSICGTDVGLSAKPSGFGDARGLILGHEIVGEVIEVGSEVTGIKIGDRIVVNPNSYCNICPSCRSGYHNHCENMELMGITAPGGFAQYIKTKERLTFPISKKVPLNHAAFAEPLSCAMNGFSRLNIIPGDTCLVIGCGPIGLLFAQLARANGARVVCAEIKDTRKKIAEKLGFTVLHGGDEPALLKEKLLALWGRAPNFCIDVAGAQLPTAIELAEYCGKILCFASPRQAEHVNLGPIQKKELTVMGSFIIHDTMPRAITVLENAYLNLDPIITHVLPLSEVGKGMELMRTGEGMEIILTYDMI